MVRYWILLLLLAPLAVPFDGRAAPLDRPYTFTKPSGPGPFPAVVIMHDCSGLGPRSSGAPKRWADLLNGLGYATLLPDSFSTRGHPNGVCTDGSAPVVTYRQRAADAYAALAFLQEQPDIDPKRIAVMGGSHGGSTTLVTDLQIIVARQDLAQGFAAAIALYPGCGITLGDWSVQRDRASPEKIIGYSGVYKPAAPLLILIGALDDWTPAEPCRQLTATAQAAGYPVEIVVYPDAHHSFDSDRPVNFNDKRRNMNAPGGHGATTGGNAAAWADAKQQVQAFLAANLK